MQSNFEFGSPGILVITASDFDGAEDLTDAIQWVHEKMLRVDVLTLTAVHNAALFPLTIYGQVFAGM